MNGIFASSIRSFPVPFLLSQSYLVPITFQKKWTAFRNGNYFFRSLTCMGFIFGIKQGLKKSKLLFLNRLTIAKITNSLAMWHLRSAFWYILTSNCCKKAFFSSILIFLLTILQNPNLAQYGSTRKVYLIFFIAHLKNECCWTSK